MKISGNTMNPLIKQNCDRGKYGGYVELGG